MQKVTIEEFKRKQKEDSQYSVNLTEKPELAALTEGSQTFFARKIL